MLACLTSYTLDCIHPSLTVLTLLVQVLASFPVIQK